MDGTSYRLPFVPKGGWVEERYIRCGKRCTCLKGQPHGVYWRLCWREGRRRHQRYVPARHAAGYAEAVRRRRQEQAERTAWFEAAAVALRHARQVLRLVG